MGSGGRARKELESRDTGAAGPVARAPRTGETGTANRAARLRAVQRASFRNAINAGETGGFQGGDVTRQGKAKLGG